MCREDSVLKSKGNREVSGSITVEAALVVPIVLMVVFLMLSLDFYVHDRAYYTLCAYETALTGNSFRSVSEEEGERNAKEKISLLQKAHRMPTELPEGIVRLEEETTEAEFKGRVFRMWGKGSWEYQVKGSVRRIRPEETIRKIRMAEKILPKN